LHVAIVDDDRDARYILEAVLSHLGALVTTACTAQEGLAQLRAIRPDVVVVDMLLGTGDGLLVMTQARRRLGDVPFVAISGADFDPRQLSFVGFASYLRKPLEHRDLIETIAAVAGRSRAAA
jgi:CheY-like chemotaxis protein